MSKVTMMAVIVLSTIQTLVDGKSVMFLPSEEPQKLPKDAAEDAIKKGLAQKPVKTAPAKTNAPATPPTEPSPSGDNGDDPTSDDKDQANV